MNKYLTILIVVQSFIQVSNAQFSEHKSEIAKKTQEPHIAEWLSGSWGVTFPIYGGERLDSEVKGGYNYRAGAQQIIDSLPTTGHIITNLSNFAKSYYFTLRGNENVDIATEIDESFVPSLENEAVIFDVLQMFRNAGKKNILYISTNYFDRLDDETHALWVNYYTNKFSGDEYLAYKDLVQGFILRMKDYADAYWLDTTSELYKDGHLEDFVQMIKDTHPGCAVSVTGVGAAYFEKDGEYILVDSDGLDDQDERDYKIIKFEAVNTYQDFTRGHVTPLGQGAPPNSWAYEEFTIPAMVENPWSTFEGNKVLKHAWFPMREKWHVSSANLVFGTEDAYRFAKKIKDAKAGVTFATTINDNKSGKGFMMPDEMIIMKEINDRFLSNPIPNYEPYVRPEGAYLVGETLSTNSFDLETNKLVLFPNIVKQNFKLSKEISSAIIYNLKGQIVLEFKSNHISYDVSILNDGVYFLKTSTKNGEYQSFKFIKQ
ncbi:T9SS type A sorting domain-containing protein [uncultured Polaribacter sp.]|uniref:T9SS type A sorting domain-containing protein n=1 Tax=uncultured Polaribacter sp. TaxID=174711 RepID=UPI00261CA27B|nr:T9SS type A sorting domain-containing protein [uncultured Polaribacter sp.]